MIELTSSAEDPVLAFTVSGVVTEADYRDTFIPALEQAIAAHERIRVLVRFDSSFERYTLEAAASDARFGLQHWRGFDRVAVVSDTSWINASIRAFSVVMPCPVKVFALGEEDAARSWLTRALGSIEQIDLGGGALHMRLMGQLDASVYAEETRELDAFLSAHDGFRLLLDLRAFEGWQSLGALSEHLHLVRDHRRRAKRVAIVGDRAWQVMAQAVGRRFINAPVHYFPADEFEGAKAWLMTE